MPFDSHFINVCMVPHLCSKLDAESRLKAVNFYKKVKTATCATSIGSSGIIDGVIMIRDVILVQAKAKAYKTFLAVSIGPILQIVAVPIYCITRTGQIRNIAIAMCELGAKIMKGEMTIANWGWIALDIALFGEPIPILEDKSLMLLHNETDTQIESMLNVLGGGDGNS